MAPMFASPDIAALVAAFPPALPTREHSSLVRTSSGNNLFRSNNVLARFRGLLKTSPSRIKKQDLSLMLDIADVDWLLDCTSDETLFSRDQQSLVPQSESRRIRQSIEEQIKEACIDILELRRKYDVSQQSFGPLLAAIPGVRHFFVEDTDRRIICSIALADDMKRRISALTRSAVLEKVGLPHKAMPLHVVRELAEEALSESGCKGALEVDDFNQLWYVPADYQTVQERLEKNAFLTKVADTLSNLETSGYCEIEQTSGEGSSENLRQKITTGFRDKHGGEEPLEQFDLQADRGVARQVAVVKSSLLHQAWDELNEIVRSLVSTGKAEHESLTLAVIEGPLCDETSYLGLTKLLLRSKEHRGKLQATLNAALRDIDQETDARLAQLVRHDMSAPIQLYAAGAETVSDAGLRSRLDEYVTTHFCIELVPAFEKSVRDEAMNNERTRRNNLDKFFKSCTKSKSLQDLTTAVTKLCRKQKIEPPDATYLAEVKQELLREKLEAMQKMSRGSDVLQNLIWILLAGEREGLFMSAGRDTSRMVKLYQATGNAVTGRQLEQWRDALKAGKQSEDDLQQMRELAREVVEGPSRRDAT